MSMYDYMLKNRQNYIKHSAEFRSIFKCELSKFHNHVTGFDIVKFDAFLNVPDDISAADYITEKYGTRARKLIEILIS